MSKLTEVIKLSRHMIDADQARDRLFRKYRDQYHLRWSLPPELQALDWIHKMVVSDPHDAVEAARRMLATPNYKVTFQPYISDDENREWANMIEQLLKWSLERADDRKKVPTVNDLAKSALLYDAACVQVIDLEWQLAQARALKRSDRRILRALEAGRFVANVYAPINVHAITSGYGTDAVLLACQRPAREVYQEWGNDKLLEISEKNNGMLQYYDFMDDEVRSVVATPVGMPLTDPTDNGVIVLLNPGHAIGKHDLPFLPWHALMGGSQIEERPEDEYHPMLYASVASGSWETMNAVRTIATSLGIARGGAPTIKEEGSNPDEAKIDYMDPNRPIKAPAGNTVQPFPQPPLDPGLMELGDRIGADLQRSTVGDVLRGGQLPSGVSFSALNLATQTAAAQLKPAKELTERALAGIFKLMLRWTAYTGRPMSGFDSRERDGEYGEELLLMPEEINTQMLYIRVKIDPDVPTDKMANANAAVMLVNAGLYSKESAMNDLGIENPTKEIDRIAEERYAEHVQNLDMQMEITQASNEQQAAMLQQQAGAQQEAAAMQQLGQGGVPGGQGFNPAVGGTPPIQAITPEQDNPFASEGEDLGIPTDLGGMM